MSDFANDTQEKFEFLNISRFEFKYLSIFDTKLTIKR